MPKRPPPVPGRKPGEQPYVPTDKAEKTIRIMLARRATHEEIGMVLGIHLNTLRRHHKELLRTCFEETNNAMWHSLYEQGIGIPGKPARGKELAQPATPPNVKATIAWLKFKGGAVEEIRTVVAGDEKRPLRVRVELVG